MPTWLNIYCGLLIAMELATEGHESIRHSLLTMPATLKSLFAITITRNANLCLLLFLVILPRQKEQTQDIKHLGDSSYFIDVVKVSFAFLWRLSTSLSPCLVIAVVATAVIHYKPDICKK
ncbi:hypothetical protein KXD40_001953 [Peronospora effusa]|uniref:Uncharacterized protein n=1 Tax=Peronospora effusa TaxID=542832 RepID=A0A3M6VIP7_9STRA|nr:hypothetical protein DD238_001991 [Peronospora effusa]RQM16297.1 hypothetical protein DD237_002848 [Peronospora effusa]UIZ26562.1 hypothetical protein KXD40_001953 [Peronospora effusa]